MNKVTDQDKIDANDYIPSYRFWGDGWVLLTQKAYWESRDKIAELIAENRRLRKANKTAGGKP
jgi:hypothetical protein